MGRSITETKVTNTTNLPTAYTTMIAGENILQGDLLSVHDDGKVYWVTDPEDPYQALRPLSAPTSQTDIVMGTVDLAWGQYARSKDSSTANLRGATLTNGNVVLVASTTYGIQFRILTIIGTIVKDKTFVSSVAAASNNFQVEALATGGFVISFQSSTGSGYISKAIYDNSGNVVQAPTTIETQTQVWGLKKLALSNGNFVVAYYRLVSGLRQPFFALYNSTGTLQGSITQIHAATGDGVLQNRWNHSLDMCALSGGGFVIAFAGYDTAATGTPKVYFSRYNSSGVIQGSVTTLSYSEAGSGESILVSCAALSDGGFAIGARVKTSGTGRRVYTAKFNSSGVLVVGNLGSATKQHNGDEGALKLITTGDGGYYAVFAGDQDASFGKVHGHRYHPSKGFFEIDYGTNSGIAPVHATYNSTFDAHFWHHAYRTSSTSIPDELWFRRNSAKDIDDLGTYDVSIDDLPIHKKLGYANNKRWGHSLVIPCPGALSSPYAVYANIHQMNTGVTNEIYDHVIFHAYRLSTATFVGVATTSATAGNPVTIQILGVATTRLTFTHSYSADFTTTDPPGQKFHLVGNTCVLHGIQESF